MSMSSLTANSLLQSWSHHR